MLVDATYICRSLADLSPSSEIFFCNDSFLILFSECKMDVGIEVINIVPLSSMCTPCYWYEVALSSIHGS